jgi:hypothetical protein
MAFMMDGVVAEYGGGSYHHLIPFDRREARRPYAEIRLRAMSDRLLLGRSWKKA